MQTHRNTLQRTARCNAAVQSHIKEGLLLKKAELHEEYGHTKKYMYEKYTYGHSATFCVTLQHNTAVERYIHEV